MDREEKEREEKEEGEKAEKWARDPISGVFTGLVLIVLGLCLFGATAEQIAWITWENFWAYFLAGLGLAFIVEAALRYAIPAYRRPVFGRVIAGAILILIGAGNIIGFKIWWPFILVAIGLVILVYGITRATKPPT